jgi:hypothetical protein
MVRYYQMKVIFGRHNFTTAQESIQIDRTEGGHFKTVINYAVGDRVLKAPGQEGSLTVERKEIVGDSEDDVRERVKVFLNQIFNPSEIVDRRHAYQIKVALAIAATALCALHSATAYPTDSMSCSDIGDFAAATVAGKQNGRTLKEALATVNELTADYPIEHKNTTQIVRAIYTWAKGLSEDGARAAFTADCEAQE